MIFKYFFHLIKYSIFNKILIFYNEIITNKTFPRDLQYTLSNLLTQEHIQRLITHSTFRNSQFRNVHSINETWHDNKF